MWQYAGCQSLATDGLPDPELNQASGSHLALGADMREGQVSVLPGQHVETEPGGQAKLLCRMNYGLLLVSYLGFRAHQLNKAIWCPDYGLWHQSKTIPLKQNQTRLVLVLPKELRLK